MNDQTGFTTLGVIAGMLIGFYGIAKVMLSQASADREADRAERKELTSAVRLMAENSGLQAEATVKQAKEAEARNGHLAEMTIQQGDRIMQGLETIKKQNVKHQVVEHQEIKE